MGRVPADNVQLSPSFRVPEPGGRIVACRRIGSIGRKVASERAAGSAAKRKKFLSRLYVINTGLESQDAITAWRRRVKWQGNGSGSGGCGRRKADKAVPFWYRDPHCPLWSPPLNCPAKAIGGNQTTSWSCSRSLFRDSPWQNWKLHASLCVPALHFFLHHRSHAVGLNESRLQPPRRRSNALVGIPDTAVFPVVMMRSPSRLNNAIGFPEAALNHISLSRAYPKPESCRRPLRQPHSIW